MGFSGRVRPEATDLDALKAELEGLLREKLIVECDVELLPPGTLPRFEMKAQLVRKLYVHDRRIM
jgi:phenylacetate-CoA ligase